MAFRCLAPLLAVNIRAGTQALQAAELERVLTALKVSDRCWQQIAAVNAGRRSRDATDAEQMLRLSVVPGGCRGFQYQFKFVPRAGLDPEVDLLFENDAVVPVDRSNAIAVGEDLTVAATAPASSSASFVVDRVSLSKIEGAVADYHVELKGSGFAVVGNELVDEACACKSSFSVAKKKALHKGPRV
jgi:Fe-S cluster assembly iron-binding protein IscA